MSFGDKYMKKGKRKGGKFERKRKRKMKHEGKMETKREIINGKKVHEKCHQHFGAVKEKYHSRKDGETVVPDTASYIRG
jgi:hypothetical protein